MVLGGLDVSCGGAWDDATVGRKQSAATNVVKVCAIRQKYGDVRRRSPWATTEDPEHLHLERLPESRRAFFTRSSFTRLLTMNPFGLSPDRSIDHLNARGQLPEGYLRAELLTPPLHHVARQGLIVHDQ